MWATANSTGMASVAIDGAFHRSSTTGRFLHAHGAPSTILIAAALAGMLTTVGGSAERLAVCIDLTPIRAEPWTAFTSDFPRVDASAAAGHAWRPSRWPPRPRRSPGPAGTSPG